MWGLPNIIRYAKKLILFFILPCSASSILTNRLHLWWKKATPLLYFRVLNKKLGEIGGWRGWGRGKVNSIQPEKIIFWTVKIFYCKLHPKTLEDLSTMTKGFEKIQHFGGNSILPICFGQYRIFKGNKRIRDLDFQTVFFQENSPWLLDYTTSSYKKSLAEISIVTSVWMKM